MKESRAAASVTVSAALIAALVLAAACEFSAPDVSPPQTPRPPPVTAANAIATVVASLAGEEAGPIERYDLVVPSRGVGAALVDAGIPSRLVDELDETFVGRVDLFAHLTRGAAFTLWLRGDELVGACVPLGNARLFAALYDGALAPRGFYDDAGGGMQSALRARPVRLSRITSGFGERFDAFTHKRDVHHGIDYGVPLGTPVVAVANGRVKFAGTSETAGNFVEIQHAGGFESRYLHLSRIEQSAKTGSRIVEGEVIGESGNTGRSTGPHLHYELHLDGEPVDPTATLPLPSVSLGPLAKVEHTAFLNFLEAVHDRRADEQDEHP